MVFAFDDGHRRGRDRSAAHCVGADGGQLQAAEKRVSDQNRDFTAALSDCLGGFSVVKTFRAEKEIFRLFAESNRALEQAALRRYDGILVLKDGRITESGSFDELMEQKGYFYALYTVSQ